MASSTERDERSEKVKKIFDQFDVNRDDGLDREEMAALVMAVNPNYKFEHHQIQAILDQVFRSYAEYIDSEKGLTFDGLHRSYNDGAGDVDRDFDALNLKLDSGVSASASSSVSVVLSERPNHGVVLDGTKEMVDELNVLVRNLKVKQMKSGKIMGDQYESSDTGWSASESDVGGGIIGKRVLWEESGQNYAVFLKELATIRSKADGCRSIEEAFDGHMGIGGALYDHQMIKEALKSFRRASELNPADVKAHFKKGNCLFALGNFSEAKEAFILALEAAEDKDNQWSYSLPQIHVNLGIVLESEGLLLGACEHYRQARILWPTHYRALKLLGSALFGVGEYTSAERALQEAVFLQPDFVDAHCDLGSVLHAIGNDDRAILEFQKAIDLKRDHVDALYNLGGLFMDTRRYQRAAEMYGRVLAILPNHWRAQLNKAVALLGAGETEEAKKAFKEAFKMTNRVELYDAMAHLKKRIDEDVSADCIRGSLVVEPLKFRRVSEKTTPREHLAFALDIREFQKVTRLNSLSVDLLKKELTELKVPISYSNSRIPARIIRKAALEANLRRMLSFLKAEAFQGAMKAINERILSVLVETDSDQIDLFMFYALLAPLCSGSAEKRKKTAFDALLFRSSLDDVTAQIRRSDAAAYMKYLRAVYIPSRGMSDMRVVRGVSDAAAAISSSEFFEMFDDSNWGFGILNALLKLETSDRNRHGGHSCAVCQNQIIGLRFKEIRSNFSLCSFCYCEGKVPSSCKQEFYWFKEYESDADAMKDKFKLCSLHSTSVDNP